MRAFILHPSSLRLDFARGFYGDEEAVAVLVRVVVAVALVEVGAFGELESLVLLGAPVVQVLDDGLLAGAICDAFETDATFAVAELGMAVQAVALPGDGRPVDGDFSPLD